MNNPTITPDQWEQILAIARQAAEEIAADEAAAASRAESDPPAPDVLDQAEAERGFAARLAAVLRARR